MSITVEYLQMQSYEFITLLSLLISPVFLLIHLLYLERNFMFFSVHKKLKQKEVHFYLTLGVFLPIFKSVQNPPSSLKAMLR